MKNQYSVQIVAPQNQGGNIVGNVVLADSPKKALESLMKDNNNIKVAFKKDTVGGGVKPNEYVGVVDLLGGTRESRTYYRGF